MSKFVFELCANVGVMFVCVSVSSSFDLLFAYNGIVLYSLLYICMPNTLICEIQPLHYSLYG